MPDRFGACDQVIGQAPHLARSLLRNPVGMLQRFLEV